MRNSSTGHSLTLSQPANAQSKEPTCSESNGGTPAVQVPGVRSLYGLTCGGQRAPRRAQRTSTGDAYKAWSAGSCNRVFIVLAFFVFFLAPAAAAAQNRPTPPETEEEAKKRKPGRGIRKKTDTIPDATILNDTLVSFAEVQRKPRNALLWSIVPGGGQVYNKRWWKVPLVYGGLLGMVAYADFNQTRYTRFVGALENRCLGDGNVVIIPNESCIPTEDEFDPNLVSNQALIQARNNADRARQTAYIGIFIVYVLQAVEAYTDAHLQKFDISDDLSLKVGPIPQPDGMMAAGISVPLGSGVTFKREVKTAQRLRLRGR